MPLYKNSNISTAQKSKMVRLEMYDLKTKHAHLKTRKKLKKYLIVRIELSLNENS